MADLLAANVGFVVAGYVVTVVAVAGYVGFLLLRTRRARMKVAAIAAKRARLS